MMRNGQNKRMRGRNRNNNNQHHNQNRGHHHNPLTRVYESNGPDVKIRGTAHHIAEKYLQLARDAASAGDHVTAEAHHQHAEHYLRLIAAAQEQFRQQNPHYQPPMQQANGDATGADESGDTDGQPMQVPQSFQAQPNFQQQQPQQQQPQQQQQQPQPQGGPQPYGNPQPQYSRPPQPQAQPQPQPSASHSSDVGGLPSFITGGQPQQAPQYGASNGHESENGPGERFPMHRRRRRHRPPHQGGGQEPRGDVPDTAGNE